jgi:hypothetical protein
MKRKVCVASGKASLRDARVGSSSSSSSSVSSASSRQESIDALIEFLAVFMADFESWAELADLYLKEQMYAMLCLLLVFPSFRFILNLLM